MDFSERPPSKRWAALKYEGRLFAEVWFKPEGEPSALTFRVPGESFRVPAAARALTAEYLLKAVGVAAAEVGSWRVEGAPPGASEPALAEPLPPPADGIPYLLLHVRVGPQPPQDSAPEQQGGEPEIAEEKWQDLEARWKALQGLEASIETLRISMEGLRSELEAASGGSLTADEKAHALNADLAQWNKAKSRVVYALPKVKDFIHRATWAAGAPERKEIEELLKAHVRPRVPFAGLRRVMDQIENLMKDRQVLSSLGVSVYQDGKSVAADVQGALRAVKANAAANASRKKGASGRSF